MESSCTFAFREVAYIRHTVCTFYFFVCVGFRGVKIKKAEEAKTKKTPQDSALWPQTFFDNVWQRTSSDLETILIPRRDHQIKATLSVGESILLRHLKELDVNTSSTW